MIAASGLDMAAWDALAKAADMPLCVLLGRFCRAVKSYNSNGLWLKEPEAVAAEASAARRRRVFRLSSCGSVGSGSRMIWQTIEAVRRAVGDEMQLMVDFNQGLDLAEACSAAT